MAKSEHIKQTLARLPQHPGVYQYFDVDRRLLYVGKAKNLKKRVSSYFTKHHDNGKTRLLVSKIHDIQWLITPSEADALLLENSLIKEHKPFYNIQLKDDKTYPFIVIKKERFPRIFATRQLIRDGSEYFGPFPSVKTMREVLELSRSIYPLMCRACRASSLKLIKSKNSDFDIRPCLDKQIGKCTGPCTDEESERQYLSRVASIKRLLQGQLSELSRFLEEQMLLSAQDFQFEKAQQYKRKLAAVKKYQAKNTIVHTGITEVEVYSIVQDSRCAYVNFLKIQNGTITKGHTSEVRRKLGEDMKEILETAIVQMRDKFGSDANTIYTPFTIDLPLEGVHLHVPQRGDKLRLVEMSERNARFFMRDRQKQMEQTHPEASTQRLLETAKEDLRLSELPVHIECFDNSNIQGTNPASACVVFKNGKPAKSDYRKFNIRTVDGPDDFASMTEVVHRRYHRLVTEGEPLPQLIVIDGGKGQLSHALEALEGLGLRGKVAIIGIAKRLEEIYYPGDQHPLYLDKRSSTLKLIQHLRNEAHRFSLEHHRKRRSKAALRSELDDIAGVGPKTRNTLLAHFKTVDAIRQADEPALLNVVSLKVAKAIQAHFAGASGK
ncbi:MAG: excinuclease ABC subunit C [Flavobacteriales bacterium]|nr:excinuclease ABC subunit C [Flavobacteriales bacterium]